MTEVLRDALWDRVRGDVDAHRPGDGRELEARARILAEMDALPRPFDRAAGPVHITGSAIVTGPRGVVLHLHKLMGIWLQPGGHLDAGETPWDAALREAAEETGLSVHHPAEGPRLVHVDVHDAPRGHLHLDLRYLIEGADGEPAPAAGESQEVRWFGWDAAVEVADPGLIGALRRFANRSPSNLPPIRR